jgi:hypothetical protein
MPDDKPGPPSGKPNPGQFKDGPEPGRYKFNREECSRASGQRRVEE